MTPDEITELQVTIVRKLTNLTAEQCSRELIVEMLKNDYPREVAAYILAARAAAVFTGAVTFLEYEPCRCCAAKTDIVP